MRTRFLEGSRLWPSLPFILLAVLLMILCLAGGASFPDVVGQPIVRFASAAAIIVAVLFCGHPTFAAVRAPSWLLLACAGLAAVQLVPLPPELWHALPGREFVIRLDAVTGQGAVWRPWTLAPSLTVNALFSLLVPAAILFLLALVPKRERDRLPGLLLVFILAATLIGLLQFSGSHVQSPFINHGYEVSGPFANRNHFALLLACGCLVAPAWGALDRAHLVWRGPAAMGLTLLFLLTALASGSRAGFALSVLALPIAVLLLRGQMRGLLKRLPKWAFGIAIAVALTLVVTFVVLAISAERGASLSRAYALDAETDLRFRTLPAVLNLVHIYLPFGSGMGTFDPVFRMHEPFELLKRTYFNRAHNDVLEVAINGGIPGLALFAAAFGWWLTTSLRTWRAGSGSRLLTARLGASLILIILLAALVDYAARTPIMMAVIAMAAFWLNLGTRDGPEEAGTPARSRKAAPHN